ncbi:MAG TPA: hypothetical protein VHF27_02510 [Acidimicrobiales bacterium]|nr:hypothetical protein [Acidimicrobiales bacterium]
MVTGMVGGGPVVVVVDGGMVGGGLVVVVVTGMVGGVGMVVGMVKSGMVKSGNSGKSGIVNVGTVVGGVVWAPAVDITNPTPPTPAATAATRRLRQTRIPTSRT